MYFQELLGWMLNKLQLADNEVKHKKHNMINTLYLMHDRKQLRTATLFFFFSFFLFFLNLTTVFWGFLGSFQTPQGVSRS